MRNQEYDSPELQDDKEDNTEEIKKNYKKAVA